MGKSVSEWTIESEGSDLENYLPMCIKHPCASIPRLHHLRESAGRIEIDKGSAILRPLPEHALSWTEVLNCEGRH